MASSKATLFSVRGRVMQFRPGISPALVDTFINARVAEVMGRRTYWSDLTVRGVIGVPKAWTDGRVAVTAESSTVIGTNANWPVSDAVSTIIRDGIFETGNQEVFPASMAGITEESTLLVDVEGVQEIVSVNQVTENSFFASFFYPHNQGCSVTQSSLVNRQFRMGNNSPIFDVMAVVDPETLIISQPWRGDPVSDQQYTLAKMYYTVVPNIRMFLQDCIVDRQQGIPIFTNVSLRSVNWQDPQRSASGDPQAFVDIGASRNGLSLYELWPTQLGVRQLDYTVYVDWPKMVNDTDRLPWFIDEEVFFAGALSHALRYRRGKDDWAHDKVSANFYEAKFKELLQDAMNADESKMQIDYSGSTPLGIGGGPGTQFYQTHVNGLGGDWGPQIGW